MNRCVTAPAAALLMALLGTALRAGAAPAARTPLHASPEPTAAQLPPVDPAWRQNGWHAVVPHGYVLRRLAPARIRPEANAPAAFWLHGGVRVPILEQRRDWWRVGWTHGRTGWVRAADLQPHAAFVLIDTRTGRVQRYLAAKGELGPVAAGGFLWSLSDTGITRTSLDTPPAIWSNPVRRDVLGNLTEESVWTPDRSALILRVNPNGTGPLVEVSARTGAVRRLSDPGTRRRLVSAGAQGTVLLLGDVKRAIRKQSAASQVSSGSPARAPLPGSPYLHRYDTRRGEEIGRALGRVVATTKAGSIYAVTEYMDGGRELIHYRPDLKPVARLALAGDLALACLSADERVLALSHVEGDGHIELRRADTLTEITRLQPGEKDGPYPHALAGGAGGWWVIAGGDQDSDACVTHYTRQGRPSRTWDADGRTTIMSADGQSIFIARESDLLVIDTERAAVRRVPYHWRRPLPARYLPPPSEPDTPTHLEISNLTLTPDGHTLVLTEWLDGDPAG